MDAANTSWILTSTALVLFMTLPGLAMFYAGLVRSKNVVSVLMQTFTIACVASIVWLLVGYSIAFGESAQNDWWGGLSKWALLSVSRDSLSGDLPETLFFMFQMTFAIITPALVVGAFVERIKFSFVVLWTIAWLVIVYAPVTHWVWGGGWLAQMGVMDFAGGIVVHATAGGAALVIAAVLGSRQGFPTHLEPPHNPGMTMIGASMLWVGWFGFNAGSALGAGADAAMAMTVTHISAATASLVWVIVDTMRGGKMTLVGIVTGMVAGLATITPASGFVGPLGALILGALAGLICNLAITFVKNMIKIDDSLDVFAVHGVGGILGTLLVAFLASTSLGGAGLGTEADPVTAGDQFMVQLIGCAAVFGYTIVATLIITLILKGIVGLRSDGSDEIEGLDVTTHGERGYPG